MCKQCNRLRIISSVNFSGSLPASLEVRMCCETASLLPALNSLVAFLMPFVCVAGMRNCMFLDLSAPITLVEKNSLSTVSIPIRMPFFVHPSMSFETVSWREFILLTIVAPRKTLERFHGTVDGGKAVEVVCFALEL